MHFLHFEKIEAIRPTFLTHVKYLKISLLCLFICLLITFLKIIV